MSDLIAHRALTSNERERLVGQGCTSANWDCVRIEEGLDLGRIRNVHFAGQVRLGKLASDLVAQTNKPTGLYNASIADCTVGRDVRIANIGVHLRNYDIGDGVCIEDVGVMETRPGASFGNGTEVEVLNEAGGREVILFNELSAQFAYLMCVHPYRPHLKEKLTAIATAFASKVSGDFGTIGRGTIIRSVKEMVDINVGEGAIIRGAARLINGTLLSTQDVPTEVGADVQAEDFIVAEGSIVAGAAILVKTFVGQGCRVDKQCSLENALLFANCEAYHGEVSCVFAGPYSVTHHKSTLLIAGMFSFFNAGSGTNQSNHMYKLGPVHEGKLERGSKTGSFSYLMWPSRVGPFSVVLGKHSRHFDTTNLPFSLIMANAQGRSILAPGLNLATVGTVRDGDKWPTRDRRKGCVKRDRISFEVFSPYTVGRMLKGSAILKDQHQKTPKDVEWTSINGIEVKRVLLHTGQKFYRNGIEMYLLEKVVERAERAGASASSLAALFAVDDTAVYSEDWLDIGGQLMPRQRLEDLTQAIVSGVVASVDDFHGELDKIADAYREDEWNWITETYKGVFNCDLDDAREDQIISVAESFLQARSRYLKLVLADARKEFDDPSRIGFGHDGTSADVDTDFAGVRGPYAEHPFVKQMQNELIELERRVEAFIQGLKRKARFDRTAASTAAHDTS